LEKLTVPVGTSWESGGVVEFGGAIIFEEIRHFPGHMLRDGAGGLMNGEDDRFRGNSPPPWTESLSRGARWILGNCIAPAFREAEKAGADRKYFGYGAAEGPGQGVVD
jgi:hypothetical protein